MNMTKESINVGIAAINQSVNNTNSSSAPVLANMSMQSVVIVSVIVLSLALIIIIGMFTGKSNSNPLVKSLFFSSIMIVLLILFEGFEVMNEGTMKKYGVWIFLALFLLLFLTYSKSSKTKSNEIFKSYKDTMWDFLYKNYGVSPNSGSSHDPPMEYFKELPNVEFSGKDSEIIYFYVRTIPRLEMFMVAIGKQSGEFKMITRNPRQEYVEKIGFQFNQQVLTQESEKSMFDRIKSIMPNKQEDQNARPVPS